MEMGQENPVQVEIRHAELDQLSQCAGPRVKQHVFPADANVDPRIAPLEPLEEHRSDAVGETSLLAQLDEEATALAAKNIGENTQREPVGVPHARAQAAHHEVPLFAS
jgi:hypothetical protein